MTQSTLLVILATFVINVNIAAFVYYNLDIITANITGSAVAMHCCKAHAKNVSSPEAHLARMVFTALHGMQTRSSDENSVCPSVRLSVRRVDCDKT